MATSTFPISLLSSSRIPTSECRVRPVQSAHRLADAVARAQAGDQDAFAELYLRHKKHVFSICMRMVRDFSLAEDLTQETFLQVHRKLASFRGDSVFSTWLHRLSVNTVLMHLRKRVLPVVSLDHMMESAPDERVGRSFGTRDLTQAGVIDRLTIEGVVATMAPGYRNIFLLHDIRGFDHGEIASMLNCSCGNTKSQLHKARRALRSSLTSQAVPGARGSACQAKGSLPPRTQTRSSQRSTRSRETPAFRVQSTAREVAT
ncbi:MAG: RNA polymerase sigma factor [Terracidiphilus sp.]